MVKILFVCHGNICRSAMAEFVLRDMARRRGAEIYVESAGTSAEELGNPVYPPVRRLLSEHGIDCRGKTARRMERGDYARFDHLIGMDETNMRGMLRICGGDPEGKMSLLMDWCGERREVDDPWYTRDFNGCWEDVNRGCRAILDALGDAIDSGRKAGGRAQRR